MSRTPEGPFPLDLVNGLRTEFGLRSEAEELRARLEEAAADHGGALDLERLLHARRGDRAPYQRYLEAVQAAHEAWSELGEDRRHLMAWMAHLTDYMRWLDWQTPNPLWLPTDKICQQLDSVFASLVALARFVFDVVPDPERGNPRVSQRTVPLHGLHAFARSMKRIWADETHLSFAATFKAGRPPRPSSPAARFFCACALRIGAYDTAACRTVMRAVQRREPLSRFRGKRQETP